MTLPEFSVRQTVLVNVLFVVCMIGGWSALQLTEVEYFHDVTLNSVVVTTQWTGASADEIERLVTSKLEEELLTVGDVDEMRSASQSNVSVISVDLDENLDTVEYESAVNDVRGAIDQAEDLPLDAEEPSLREIITAEIDPIVFIAISDEGDVGPLALRDVAQEIESRVRELPGVSKIEIRSLQDREVRVQVDRARAALHDLTLLEIADRIRRQNQNLPAGTFRDGEGEATLRAIGDYRSIDEIRDTIVLERDDGTRIRVRDLATVVRDLEKPVFITRYGGRPAALVSVAKKDETDVRHLSARIDRFLEDFTPLLLAFVHGPVAPPGYRPPDAFTAGALAFLIALTGWMPAPIEGAAFQSLWVQARARGGAPMSPADARLDFNVGYGLTAFMAVVFLLLGAWVMNGSGVAFADSAAGFAAQVLDLYRATLGGWSGPVIAAAALTAMFSTLLAITDAYPRALAAGIALLRREDDAPAAPVYWSALGIVAFVAVTIIQAFTGALRGLVDLATTLAFVSAPVLCFLNLRLITSRQVPAGQRPGRALLALSWLGIAAFTAFTLLFLASRFAPKWLPGA